MEGELVHPKEWKEGDEIFFTGSEISIVKCNDGSSITWNINGAGSHSTNPYFAFMNGSRLFWYRKIQELQYDPSQQLDLETDI